ncbi:MAG: 1-phosphofructokinase family hexose kinase [Burkholderiaceae bacterium]|nr:1-phosphofructokinase family hexose kinase [Microbacteriaceae bacterium]
MPGIVTVTAAAAIDQTYAVAGFVPGGVNRATSAHREISGKGVNVARAVGLGGHPVSAVLVLGEAELAMVGGSGFGELLHVVPVPGNTRLNTTILDGLGRTTKVNEGPVPLTRADWTALRDLAVAEVERLGADWLVLSGTLPAIRERGIIQESGLLPIRELIDLAVAAGARIAVDTSGTDLDALVRNLENIALLKPNTHELAGVVGRDLLTIGDVIGAAEELRTRGVETVYVSMGEDGALAVAATGVWWARATPARLLNTAGAGDASLAGFLVNALRDDGSLDIPAAIRAAASWGALSVSQSTTLLSDVTQAPLAELVDSPDPSRILADPGRGG